MSELFDSLEPTDLTTEELAQLAGIKRPDLGPAYLPPVRAAKVRTEPQSGSYLTRIEEGRPAWHEFCTPAAVATAWEAVATGIAAERAGRADFAQLPARETAERQAIGEAAVAGDIEILALTDWQPERVILLAKHDVLAQRVKDAAKAYDAVVSEALPAWHDELVELVAETRREALRAFKGVEPAAQAFLNAQAAAHEIHSALHPDDALPTTLDSNAREVAARGSHAAAALRELLTSEHPVLSGEYLDRNDTLRPQMWVRPALNETFAGASQLEQIEISERFRFTTLTMHERNQHLRNALDVDDLSSASLDFVA